MIRVVSLLQFGILEQWILIRVCIICFSKGIVTLLGVFLLSFSIKFVNVLCVLFSNLFLCDTAFQDHKIEFDAWISHMLWLRVS